MLCTHGVGVRCGSGSHSQLLWCLLWQTEAALWSWSQGVVLEVLHVVGVGALETGFVDLLGIRTGMTMSLCNVQGDKCNLATNILQAGAGIPHLLLYDAVCPGGIFQIQLNFYFRHGPYQTYDVQS